MPWYLPSLLFLIFLSCTDSKYQGLPDQIKHVHLSSVTKNKLFIGWKSFESDIISFKYQIENLNNGTKSEWHEVTRNAPGYDIEPNGTYRVNVVALNKQGEGPPSPDVFFYNGPEERDHLVTEEIDQAKKTKCKEIRCAMGQLSKLMNWLGGMFGPQAPRFFRVISNSGDRANITWRHERYDREGSPIEYTLHYADTKNLSNWSTIKTNNKWIILENLKNGTVYNAYVTGNEEPPGTYNLHSDIIPIMAYKDMTGLPEPVITIEPSSKNGVFSPGDRITVRCSMPPNTKMEHLNLQLTVGSRRIRANNERSTSIHINKTTAKNQVNTATCRISYSNCPEANDPVFATRASTRSWTVLPGEGPDERRQDDIEDDQMDFRKI